MARSLMSRGLTLSALRAALEQELDSRGLDAVQAPGRRDGDLARPRRFEIAAALNRLRTATFAAPSGGAF